MAGYKNLSSRLIATTFWILLVLNLAWIVPSVWARGASNQISEYVHTSWRTEDGLPQNSVNSILQTADGYLWLGTQEGLVRFNGVKFDIYDRSKEKAFKVNPIDALLQDGQGNLWIGTFGGGLVRYRNGGFQNYSREQGLSDYTVTVLQLGRDGSLWVAMDSGLRRYKDGQVKLYRTDKGPANNDAWSVIEDRDGNVWVGTKGGGLNELVGDRVKTYTTRDGLADNQIYAVLQDHSGDIWVGTPSGLSRFRQGRFTNYSRKDGLSGQYVWCIFEDSTQNLWIGTDVGMSLFRDGKFTNYGVGPSGAQWIGGVSFIHEDRDHFLWLGTDASGLKRFKNGEFKTIDTSNGMFDDTVWAVLEDDQGNFWMSSNRGIFRVAKSEIDKVVDGKTERIHYVVYDTSDGMPSTECNGDSQSPALKTRDGRLLFACVGGVVAVTPGNLHRTLFPPPVVIESAKANGKDLAANARVPVGRGELKFQFAALSYVSPKRVTFQYRLEGYTNGQDWTDAGTTYDANYTNLPPGDYIFHVIANNSGVSSTAEATFHVYLLPRFYQTTWFYLVCGLAVLGLGVSAYLLRTRKIRKRAEELVVLVDDRTEALQQEVLQRKRAEEALSRTAAIVESSSDAIWSIDRQGKIVTWNSGAEKLFGYTAEEAVGQPALLIVPPERTWELEHYLALMLEGEPVTSLETVRRRKDGTLLDVSLNRSPILKDGKVVAISVIALDISERKRSEEALQQAKDAAEAATRAKSEFLANMSHEIRTPLNGVIGTLDLAGHTRLTSEQNELLAMAKDSAKTLLVLINDILDFSKIEAGKLEFDFAEFDLREMISGTMRDMTLRADEKQLVLSYSISPDLPQCLVGDAVRLKQVLTNLLGNAIKFTERGQIVLTAEADGTSDDVLEVKFSVADTGIGIPEEKQQVIFEAFSQADASTTRKFGGTGLGLAICSRIVALMGGRIWVESQPGNGSTFRFTAKLKIAAQPTAGAGADGAVYRREHYGSLRILVAEDNLVNQKVAARILEAAGHHVAVANSGTETLEKLHERPFDLVLMDLQMPEMDGFAATRAIREGEKLTGLHVPIIAMTAHAMKGDRERCLQMGMDEYISKPIDSNGLLQLIARVMDARDEKKPTQSGFLHTV